MKKNIQNRQGFTLIEIIVAMALLGILSVFILSGIQFAMKTLYADEHYMQSNYDVQGKLDDFIGTKTSSDAMTKSIEFTWAGTSPIPSFIVTGLQLKEASGSLYLSENFKAFVPTAITTDSTP